MEYTKGKWEIDFRPCYKNKGGEIYGVIQTNHEARIIGRVEQSGGIDRGGCPLPVNSVAEIEANARLIAASPTMYAFIKEKADLGDTGAIKIISKITLGL